MTHVLEQRSALLVRRGAVLVWTLAVVVLVNTDPRALGWFSESIVFLFMVGGPGTAFVVLAARTPLRIAVILGLGLSLSSLVVVSQVLLSAHGFTPTTVAMILAGETAVLSVLPQLRWRPSPRDPDL